MITEALKRIYSGSNVNRSLEALEFRHPNWPDPVRLVNDVVGWTFTLETGVLADFIAMPFDVKLPDKNTAGAEDLQVALCNIGREMMDLLELASSSPEDSITCLFRVFLDIPNSAPQINPPLRLQITSVAATLNSITATATRFDVLNRPFPTTLYTLDSFPGLRR